MPYNVDGNFAPIGNAQVEVAPATLVSTFRVTFGGAPTSQYIVAGHKSLPSVVNPSNGWIMYTRSVMSMEIASDGSGGALVIEVGSDNLNAPAPQPVWHDWIPLSIPGFGLPGVVTGFDLPALAVRFRLYSSDPVGAVMHGSIIVRAL